MKQLVLAGLLFAGTLSLNAQELPQPSPAATSMQRVGLTDVTVTYSRPSVKGREIWGDLVPYDKIWRTGANEATKLTFSTDVMIDGKNVPAGDYSLYTVPGKEKWTVIVNSKTGSWGTDGFDEAMDVARFEVTPEKADNVESMMIYMDNVRSGAVTCYISWAGVKVGFDIEVDFMSVAEANIDAAIKELDRGFRVYNSSASFHLNNEGDVKKALEYAQKSVEMEKRFWNVKTLSEAYAANGDYKMALETAEESLKMSQEAEYDPYIKMNEENIAKWKKMK